MVFCPLPKECEALVQFVVAALWGGFGALFGVFEQFCVTKLKHRAFSFVSEHPAQRVRAESPESPSCAAWAESELMVHQLRPSASAHRCPGAAQ